MYHILFKWNIIYIKIMKIFKLFLLSFILITPVKANTIYNLIKIPNLEIYELKTPNNLKYFYAESLLYLVFIRIYPVQTPVEAEPMKYLMSEDKKIMNRNSLLEVSKEILNNNKDFKAPLETKFKLPGKTVKEEMNKILEKLYNEKIILDHGLLVAQELAHVL